MRPKRLALALLAPLAGAACTPAPTCTGEWCGTVVVLTSAEADVLLPPVARSDVGIALSDLLFLKLADVGPELGTVGDEGFVPQLAASWSFEDARTLVFTMHPDARWHDGAPVTAHDVAFTFDVYRDTLIASIGRPRLGRITSVTARDDRTAVFRFRSAYPQRFFDAVYHMRILPRHLLDSIPLERLAGHPFGRQPIGSGPFRFVQWAAGEVVELEGDSTFFLGRPGPRRVVWRFTSDRQTALAQLLAGEADVLSFVGGPEEVSRVEEADHLRAVPYPTAVYAYIGFNFRDPDDDTRPHPLFHDRALRRALAMAVDRETVVRAVLGPGGRVPRGPISPAIWIWSDGLRDLPFDSARSRAMLADLGWQDTDGDGVLDRGGRALSFELIVPTSSAARRRAAQIVQEQYRQLGVQMRIAEMEFNTFQARSDEHHFDAMFGAYGGEITPGSVREVWGSEAIGGFNTTSYSNPEVDRLAAEADEADDLERSRTLWHEAIELLNEDAPAIWMYSPVTTAGVHARLDNVTIRPDQWAAALWTWRVPVERRIARDRYVR